MGHMLTIARTQKGLTKKAVADACGVSATAVTYWEREQDSPREEFLPILAGLLGLNEGELALARWHWRVRRLTRTTQARLRREMGALERELTRLRARYGLE